MPSLRRRGSRIAVLAVVLACAGGPVAAAQTAPAPSAAPVIPPGGPVVRLQVRIFDGADDVTRDTRVRLYQAGRRDQPIATALGPDQAYEADVPIGLYDVQAITEKAGEVAGVRWVERLLVQKYPDEFGRHLQVINLRGGFGALQIRPEGGTAGPAGWSAVATRPGTPEAPVARAKAAGADLLLVMPAGSYDVKVVVPGAADAWIRAIDVPDQRTRMKTWPPP